MGRKEALGYISPPGGELVPSTPAPPFGPPENCCLQLKPESLAGRVIGLISAFILSGEGKGLPPPELIAQQQPHHSPIIIQAPERNSSGVIFEAKPQPLLSSQESQETEVSLPDQVLLILEKTVDEAAMQQAIEHIKTKGGKIVHVFPPHVLIGSLSQEQETALLGQAGIAAIHREALDPSTVAEETQMAMEVWNNLIKPKFPAVSAQKAEEPPTNDALIAPDLPKEIQVADGRRPDHYQTSEFMIGDVAVGIILPESDGTLDPSIEDWTPEEEIGTFKEIVEATNWWALREPRANLMFTYDLHSKVPTSYELINHSSTNQGLWIGEVMARLGYESSSYFAQVRDYNNALRHQYQTDWAFTIFVADSSKDRDNRFSDGYFAYAYLGGPFTVMTNGNNGYGPDNLDAVAAHEIGHIFRAVDQYYLAHQACTYPSGHLRVENQNSQYGDCLSNEDSIMRGLIGPYWRGAVDYYARGQVGWRDFDRDGTLTPVDDDELGAEFYPPPPATNPNPVLRGLAVAAPQVAQVEYRICGQPNPWQPATPADGVFGQLAEPFTFSPGPLGRGGHCFEVRVTDNQERVQPEPYPKLEIAIMGPVIWLPLIFK